MNSCCDLVVYGFAKDAEDVDGSEVFLRSQVFVCDDGFSLMWIISTGTSLSFAFDPSASNGICPRTVEPSASQSTIADQQVIFGPFPHNDYKVGVSEGGRYIALLHGEGALRVLDLRETPGARSWEDGRGRIVNVGSIDLPKKIEVSPDGRFVLLDLFHDFTRQSSLTA